MKKTLTTLLLAMLGVAPLAMAADAASLPTAAAMPAMADDETRERWTILIPELYAGLFLAGTVTHMDRDAGILGLDTDAQGKVDLQFSPEALRASNVKVGDVAVVSLGYSVDQRTVSAESCDVLPIKLASC